MKCSAGNVLDPAQANKQRRALRAVVVKAWDEMFVMLTLSLFFSLFAFSFFEDCEHCSMAIDCSTAIDSSIIELDSYDHLFNGEGLNESKMVINLVLFDGPLSVVINRPTNAPREMLHC